jgi:hypothetical protein
MWQIFGGRSEYRAAPRIEAEKQRIRWQAERQAEYDANKENPPPSVPEP